MGKHKHDDYKQSAVDYYFSMEEPSIRVTCEIFRCKRESLRLWIKRYLEYGTVSNKQRKEGSYKVRKIHVKFIMNTIKKKPTIIIKELLKLVNDKFNYLELSSTHLNE